MNRYRYRQEGRNLKLRRLHVSYVLQEVVCFHNIRGASRQRRNQYRTYVGAAVDRKSVSCKSNDQCDGVTSLNSRQRNRFQTLLQRCDLAEIKLELPTQLTAMQTTSCCSTRHAID